MDVQLFGLNPGWHHGSSLCFHVANTVLLFLLLRRLTSRVWPSAFVAALFALHPLHVESVAWVSERKDVLSTFFGLLSLLAYARFAEVQSRETEVQSPMSKVQGWEPEVQGSRFEVQGSKLKSRQPAAVERLASFLSVWLALALLATGCAGPRPLKGGKAVTTRKPAGIIEQTLVQGENPSQPTKQDQETVKIRSFTVPAGSRIEQSQMWEGERPREPKLLRTTVEIRAREDARPPGRQQPSTLNSQPPSNPQPPSLSARRCPSPNARKPAPRRNWAPHRRTPRANWVPSSQA
jgi:hypothetical protein